jgi:membrane protease YdiL (CAAX protease family)
MTNILIASALTAVIFFVLALAGRLRAISLEFPSRVRRGLGWALLWSAIYGAIALPAVLAGEDQGLAAGDLSLPSLFVGHAGLSAFLLLWWILRRPIRVSRFLYLDTARVSDLAGGVTLGFRVWLLTFGIAAGAGLILQIVLEAGDSHPGAALDLPEIPDVMVWMVSLPIWSKLTIVAVAMTVEEAFFRAFLQSRIGLIPSSLLFALGHASYGLPTLMIGVFVVSIIIGRDFAQHGSLARCMLAHGVFDAIQLLLIVPFAVSQLQQLQAVTS